jgi:hypothetical protein
MLIDGINYDTPWIYTIMMLQASPDKCEDGTAFQDFKRLRSVSSSIDEFINLPNERPQEALEFERLGAPDMAFVRKCSQKRALHRLQVIHILKKIFG